MNRQKSYQIRADRSNERKHRQFGSLCSSGKRAKSSSDFSMCWKFRHEKGLRLIVSCCVWPAGPQGPMFFHYRYHHVSRWVTGSLDRR
jgi:hypothetical protein